jgi:hypothetical protein
MALLMTRTMGALIALCNSQKQRKVKKVHKPVVSVYILKHEAVVVW